jgi:hypothetical protein
LNLSSPPDDYSRTDQAQMRDAIRRADGENFKRGRDIEAGGGRVILTSPDGNRWALTVSNAGVVGATAI